MAGVALEGKIKPRKGDRKDEENISFALLVSFICFLAFVAPALAGPNTPASTAPQPALSGAHPNFVIQPNHVIVSGPAPILDINYNVTNDEDSGIFGYWALDNYTKAVQVWQITTGDFYFEAQYTGTWKTFKGALSPEVGITQDGDVSGKFAGGYTATCTGALLATPNPSTLKAKGYIGSFNYGGSKADILLKTYVAGQTGPTTPFNFVAAYFDSACNGSFTQPTWGWFYNDKDNDQTWYNFYTINVGDIISWE